MVKVMWKEEVPKGTALITQGDLQDLLKKKLICCKLLQYNPHGSMNTNLCARPTLAP